MINTSPKNIMQLQTTLSLLNTLQTLETYKEFCYQLYLLTVYGAGGARYYKHTEDVKTYYLGKAYEEQIKGQEETQICYISIGGKTIGTHTQVINKDYVPTNSNYKETPFNRYFHTDALGSITAITDDTGTVVERRSYEPFGKIRAMDYGTNNNTISNQIHQTTRAYTGHEQIKEISGLIHMNARVYDSDIGRFLSADTIIQDPHDSQSYNRYSYVRNNPMKYTDPTGNSWWTKFRDKWVKPVVSIVISAVIIAATMGYGALAATWVGGLNVVQAGALVGGISGGIMTGSLTGAVKGAVFGAISAGIANGIGTGFESAFGLEHGATLFSSGKVGAQFLKAASHGLSRAAISMVQGGTFKSGFASGFASSFFSPGTSLGDGTGGFTLRTTIAGVVGGTASEIGGGKFANGAISGAFVHMFNAEWRLSWSVSGGVVAGGTAEQGISVAYDTSKPWYRFFSNWSSQKFTTISYGAYADASASAEFSLGASSGQTADVVIGDGITAGSSINTFFFPVNGSMGAEVFIPSPKYGNINLYNISFGVDTPGGLPMESHTYYTKTTRGGW